MVRINDEGGFAEYAADGQLGALTVAWGRQRRSQDG